MKPVLVFTTLVFLAACGADGEPIRPTEPKVSTTIGIGTNGTRASTNVSFGLGEVRVGIGRGL